MEISVKEISIKKAYTDLEQSKKLAEILSIESADMEYMFLRKDNSMVNIVPFIKDGTEEPNGSYTFIHCWSLAALLNVILNLSGNKAVYSFKLVKHRNYWKCFYENFESIIIGECFAYSLVDACYKMILDLHEKNLL